MPSASDIKAGAAYVELYLEKNKFVRGLRIASHRLKAFSANVGAIGARFMAASAAMALPFIAATKVYADFETQMASVSTMLDDTEKHMGRFREGIKQMQVEFGESADTLAKGLYDILSASVAPEKALSVLAVAARAAQGGMTDTAVAADAITTVLNSYGLAADRAADVSDWLFTIVKRGKTTFGELAPNIGLVASTAASAGVGLDELGAGLAVLTRSGVKTENAVTAVNAIVASFLKPTDDAAKYAKTLGFELNTLTIKTLGLEGVFKRIAALPPEAIARLFPNMRALRGVIPALKNLKGFSGDVAAMANRAGAAGAAFDKMARTIGTSLARIKQKMLVMLTDIGQAIGPAVRAGADAVGVYAQALGEWIKENQAAVATTLKAVVALGAIGVALTATALATSILGTAIGGLCAMFRALSTALFFLVKNPVMLIGVAIGALVIMMIDWEAVLKRLGGAIGSLLPGMDRMAELAGKSAERIKQEHESMKDKVRLLASLKSNQERTNEETTKMIMLTQELTTAYPLLAAQIASVGSSAASTTKMLEAMNAAFAANVREKYQADLEAVSEQLGGKGGLHRRIQDVTDKRRGLQEERKQLKEIPIGGRSGQISAKRKQARLDEIGRELATLEKERSRLERKRSLARDKQTALEGALGAMDAPAATPGRFPLGDLAAGAGKNLLGGGKAMVNNAAALAAKAGKALKDAWAKEMKSWEGISHELKTIEARGIEDDLNRELALMRLHYAERIRLAKEAGKRTDGLEIAREKELAQIRNRHNLQWAKKTMAEHIQNVRRKATAEQSVQNEIDRLKIMTTMKGARREAALLELEKRKKLAWAKAQGIDTALVEREFALRSQQQNAAALGNLPVGERREAKGAFSAIAAMRGLGAAGPIDKIADATKKTAENTRTISKTLAKGRMMVFT